MSTTHQPSGVFLKADTSSAFWGMFSLAFVILFVFALASSVLGVQWRSILPGAENAKGVVGGVKAAVYTFMSYIF